MIPILLAIIALIGAWVAFQQMLIARTKLNHDLFDRRFAVYSATRLYVVEMLRNKGGSQEDAVKWYAVASAAPFLFSSDLADHIKEIARRGARLRARVGDKFVYEIPEHVQEYNENMMWMNTTLEFLEDRFHGSMNLFRLNPLSLRDMFGSRKNKGASSKWH